MKKKYQKQEAVMVDLHERKNIKIIKSDDKGVSDEDMNAFLEQLKKHSDIADDFCQYYINKQIESEFEMSDSEFNMMIKKLMKQHKIFKSLLKGQED